VSALPSQFTDPDFLATVNAELRDQSPQAICRWAVSLGLRHIVTTSMGVNAGATLHAAVAADPDIPVVWIDTGFNLKDTYITADRLAEQLALNLHVYSPIMTSERINARLGGIPTLAEQEQHRWFTHAVKLEPFQRALAEFDPGVWITGIRAEETAHRAGLDIVTLDKRGMLKVAPFFYQTEQALENYLMLHDVPTCRHYFDPTKIESGRECGLHTAD